MRGAGLPGCGRGVTVPTSTKPNPSPNSASTWAPFLSRPAARPTGFGNSSPSTRVGNGRGGAPSRRPRPSPCTQSSARRPAWWARSASSANSSGRNRPYISVLHPQPDQATEHEEDQQQADQGQGQHRVAEDEAGQRQAAALHALRCARDLAAGEVAGDDGHDAAQPWQDGPAEDARDQADDGQGAGLAGRDAHRCDSGTGRTTGREGGSPGLGG